MKITALLMIVCLCASVSACKKGKKVPPSSSSSVAETSSSASNGNSFDVGSQSSSSSERGSHTTSSKPTLSSPSDTLDIFYTDEPPDQILSAFNPEQLSPSVVRYRLARINTFRLLNEVQLETVRFNLFDDSSLTVIEGQFPTPSEDQAEAWTPVDVAGNDSINLFKLDHGFSVSIITGDIHASVWPSGIDDWHVIAELDFTAYEKDDHPSLNVNPSIQHPPLIQPQSALTVLAKGDGTTTVGNYGEAKCDRPPDGTTSKLKPPTVVRILFLFTRRAIDESSFHSLQSANDEETMKNVVSASLAKIRPAWQSLQGRAFPESAGHRLIDYTESAAENLDMLSELEDLTYGRGALSQVPELRNQLEADIVVLLTGYSSKNCGIAWNPTTPSAEYGFTVVATNCSSHGYTLPHEIGHIMSMNHDREPYKAENETFLSGFDFGYIDLEKEVRSIMSYNDACESLGKNCQRIGSYSHPGLASSANFKIIPQFGVAIGNPQPSHNRELFCRYISTLSQFR